MRNLIGKAAAAAILGKPVTWVSYAVQRGILSYYRIGSQIRFDPVELDDWCRRQRVPAADEYETARRGPTEPLAAMATPRATAACRAFDDSPVANRSQPGNPMNKLGSRRG